MEESSVIDDSLQQFLATGMLPDASAFQSNGKSVNEAQLQDGSGAQIHVLPAGSSGLHANAQIRQLQTHPQDHLGPQQSQSQSSGSGRAIGTNVLFGTVLGSPGRGRV